MQGLSHALKRTITDGISDVDSLEGDSVESDSDDEMSNENYRKAGLLEHIAGPECTNTGGYNGHNISAEEMMGSGTVQCLVRKTPEWQPEAADQDWELFSEYFLSGLACHMESRDASGAICLPIRHGLEEELHPDESIFGSWEYKWDCPMPFHPTCMEVFKRVSSTTSGRFDVDALGFWRWSERNHNGIDHRAHPALNRALQNSSTWHHENGDEWLAGNPILVPALTKVLQPALIEDGILFSEQDSAFPITRPTRSDIGSSSRPAPFASLPREILNLIIGNLGSYDVAAMRLNSRTFTHLSIFLWRQFLLKEMPWLWEIWEIWHNSDTSQWALISSAKLHEEHKRLFEAAHELRDMQEWKKWIIRKEYPEHYDKYCLENLWVLEDVDAAMAPVLVRRMAEKAKERAQLVCKLPQNRTNWYMVYTQITRHWNDLKGLRNRERIWQCCNDIAQRIEKFEVCAFILSVSFLNLYTNCTLCHFRHLLVGTSLATRGSFAIIRFNLEPRSLLGLVLLKQPTKHRSKRCSCFPNRQTPDQQRSYPTPDEYNSCPTNKEVTTEYVAGAIEGERNDNQKYGDHDS